MKEEMCPRRTICIVGLGYVGLPTAVLCAESGFEVIGVDVKPHIVESINRGECPLADLALDGRLEEWVSKGHLRATMDLEEAMETSEIILVIVPTPVTSDGDPDLTCLVQASKAIGRNLKKGQLVIFESTVYPGCTEEVCLPLLEQESGLREGSDFGIAYCPERYNPADVEHTIEKVSRVVGAIDKHSLERAVDFYKSFLRGTIHTVSGIKEAEATKVLENSQRNVNIAFMNEMARMFEKMGLDFHEVIKGASSKFNFVNVNPGPGVGGHCIPVDPLYLIFKSLKSNYVPKLLLSACEINNSMPLHVKEMICDSLKRVGKDVSGSKIAILGLAYKENVGDIRESPALALVSELRKENADVSVHDPLTRADDVRNELGLDNQDLMSCVMNADCIVLLTGHDEFRQLPLEDIAPKLSHPAVFVDTRAMFSEDIVNGFDIDYCRIGDGRNNGR